MTNTQTRSPARQRAVFAIFSIFSALNALPGLAATFVVNVSTDDADAAIDGICETATGNSSCSLRAALMEANAASPAPDARHLIHFDIPPADACFVAGIDHCVITMSSVLPDIVQPVDIDGSTQPGAGTICSAAIPDRPAYPVVLDGRPTFGAKLRLEAGSSGSRIRGLNMQKMYHAVAIIRSDDNVIACNFIGTDHLGANSNDSGSEFSAIIVGCSSNGNIIGGPGSGDGNLISGSVSDAVQFNGDIPCIPDEGTPDGNYVLGNHIGTFKDGVTAYGNIGSGITMFGGDGPDDNLVGLMPDGGGGFLYAANVVGDNAGSGMYIGANVSGAVIAGNLFGTDRTETVPLPNAYDGIYVEAGNNLLIGGPTPADDNVFAYNTYSGISVDNGAEAIRIQGNHFYGNGDLGIDLGLDSITPNDPDDSDSGANTLLNYPDILGVVMDGGMLTIDYSVPVDGSAPNLPLEIAFYIADGDSNQGLLQIGTDTYAAAGIRQVTIPAGAFQEGDRIVATSTDSAGNTSEFTATEIFSDGFED